MLPTADVLRRGRLGDPPPKHVEAEEVEQEIVCFSPGEEESKKWGVLEETVGRVLCCVSVDLL